MKKTYYLMTKELKSFFISPVGYVCIFIYTLLSGWNIINSIFRYHNISIRYNSTQATNANQIFDSLSPDIGIIQPILGFSSLLILFLFPAITMKLFAEEKRSGSFELLITSPLKLEEIILGKFFGAMLFVTLLLSYSMLCIILVFIWSKPELNSTIIGIFGVFLFASSIVAFGLFTSTLTENQIIAFFIAFGGTLFFYILNWYSYHNSSSSLADAIAYFSILTHLMNFLRGIFSLKDTIFFVSFTTLFLFLAYRKLEMSQWR